MSYNPYDYSKKKSSKKEIMPHTSRYALMDALRAHGKELPPHPTKSNFYNSAVRSHIKIPMMSVEDAMCAKRYPDLADFSKDQLIGYLQSKGVNTAGMAKIDACHKIATTEDLSGGDILDFVNGSNTLGKRRKSNRRKSNRSKSNRSKSNRPKSRKSCMKRHMKWNSSSKRCNKKSLK